MKPTILLILIFAAAVFLTGCGHYGMGMGRHYHHNYSDQEFPGHHNMNGNSMHRQDGYWR